MARNFQLDGEDGRRNITLGSLGEQIAEQCLISKGFTKVKNLNLNKQKVCPFADLYAEEGGRRFCISVKTRNKFEANGKLNKRYRFKHYSPELIRKVCQQNGNAEPAWITVQVEMEQNQYKAYFGTLAELNGRHAVPMGENSVGTYRLLDRGSYLFHPDLKRTYKKIGDSVQIIQQQR
jgi:hypothetical protein